MNKKNTTNKVIAFFLGMQFLSSILCVKAFPQNNLLVIHKGLYMVMNGGTNSTPFYMIVNQSNPAAIKEVTSGSGWIISEGEYNYVQWNIDTATGTYTIPFGYGTTTYLPLTMNITTGGTGTGIGIGNLLFSTYRTPYTNLPLPTDPPAVENLTINGIIDDAVNLVDRWWIINANNYTIKPSSTLLFTYASPAELASPNNITRTNLRAMRWNSNIGSWGSFVSGSQLTTASLHQVTNVIVPPDSLFSAWVLVDTSSSAGIQSLTEGNYSLSAYPNPNNGNFILQSSGTTYKSSIGIYDILGERIYQTELTSVNTPISLANQPNGVYLYRVITENGGMIGSGRIVVQH